MAQAGDGKELFGKVITMLGGSGFFGKHLAQELLARGARLRIASRNPQRAFRLRPLGGLGQVQFVRCDVTRPDSLGAALAGADAVVNLVGSFTGDLDVLQGRGAGRIAAAARAAGASAFVHVSAIGADAQSRSAYARSKGEGEAAVLAAFPQATLIRPSILFGADDRFVTMFAGLIASFPALPVFCPDARLQPVLVDDAAEAIAQVLGEPAAHAGKTYEIAGPEVLTMLELNERIAAAQQRRRLFMPLPDGLARIVAVLPGTPISSDQLALLRAGNVASGALPGLKELEVTARPLGLFLDRWMVRFRKQGRFGGKLGANG
jgi:NADH dehydrogenase